MHIDAIKFGLLCISDSPRANRIIDTTVAAVTNLFKKFDFSLIEQKVISCNEKELEWELKRLCEYAHVDVVLTLGAIGLSPRDITPDCTLSIIESRLEGIELAIRLALKDDFPESCLWRFICGIHNRTIVINFPEEPEQVNRCLESLNSILPLAVYSVKTRPSPGEE